MKMSLILWLLDVKKNIGFFFLFLTYKTEPNRNRLVGIGFSLVFVFFSKF